MADTTIQSQGKTIEEVLPKQEIIPHQEVVNARNFWLAISVQLFIIATIPAAKIYTINAGTTVFIKTRPVDPYDLLRGYYQTLSYDISDRHMLSKLPGGEFLKPMMNNQNNISNRVREVFVILELPKTDRTIAKPVAVAGQKPTNLPNDHLAIRGMWDGGQIKYGLEQFYMPEVQAKTVNNDVTRNQQKVTIEVKVDRGGNSALIGLWIGDKKYSF
jgi:uncharacterized membrane-anchored protein